MKPEEFLQLKKEVNALYEIMMQMHQAKRRDVIYANARAAYMEKNNLLQQALEEHPEYNDL